MNGLNYMHEKGYAHRDIKPENLLLTSDFVLKIADFGFATLLEGKDKSGVLHTKLGTDGYMAPEVQKKNYIGTQADIFSSGVILFIMYTASPPFEKSVPEDPYYRLIKDRNFTTFWNFHSKRRPAGFFTDDFKDLINKMLSYDPQERPTMLEVAEHPWVKGPVLTLDQMKDEFTLRKKKIDIEA
jgi:serine/threonine protein kinase